MSANDAKCVKDIDHLIDCIIFRMIYYFLDIQTP